MSTGSNRDHEHEHTHRDGTTHSHPHETGQHHGAEGQTGRTMAGRATDSDEVAVPVAEERLRVEKRQAELGEVQVRKTVTEEEQTIPVELQREEVHVERRDVSDRPAAGGERLFQEQTIRVPVRGEEAQVTKEAVVTGEVVIEKERTTERQEIRDTVRRERVEVDEDYDQYRPTFQQHFGQRQQAGRSWEEAEPNYQYGYMAGRNSQYQGRQFEDVEGDLRSDYQSRFGSGGQGGNDRNLWDRLREEVREGWDRSRGAR